MGCQLCSHAWQISIDMFWLSVFSSSLNHSFCILLRRTRDCLGCLFLPDMDSSKGPFGSFWSQEYVILEVEDLHQDLDNRF